MSFDLQNAPTELAQDNQGATVPILTKDGEPATDSAGKPVTFAVIGKYADRIRSVQEAQTKRMLKARVTSLQPGDIRKNRVEVASVAVTGWSGVEDGGQPLACTTENVSKVLTAMPWVLEQVEQAVESHARFFTSSSTG